jgi:pimeloyl-ACP methyl ester carboxylesterase
MVFAGPIVALNTKLRILAKTGLTLAKFIGFQNFYAVTAKLTLPRKNHKKSREIFVRESKFISDFEYKKWTAMYGKTLDDTLLKLFHHNPNVSLYMLVGAQDHLFIQPAMAYAKRFANVSIEIIERCGHLVSLEKADIFNQKCLSFLESMKR